LLKIAVFVAALCGNTISASAEESADASAKEPTKSAASKQDGRFPMTLRLGSEAMTGEINRVQITKADVSAGLALDAIPRLTLYVDMLIGVMHLGIDATLDDGLKGNTDIWSYADLSARTGASVRMFDRRYWKLDTFAEYESSLIGLAPEVTTLRINNADGAFDISPFGAEQVMPEIFWNRFTGGLKFSAEFGRFTPSISVAYQATNAELDLRLSDDGRETVKLLGYKDSAMERRHSLDFWAAPIVLGLEYQTSPRFSLGAEGVVMPAGNAFMYGGGIACRYHL
jgi:hypothetical protein